MQLLNINFFSGLARAEIEALERNKERQRSTIQYSNSCGTDPSVILGNNCPASLTAGPPVGIVPPILGPRPITQETHPSPNISPLPLPLKQSKVSI